MGVLEDVFQLLFGGHAGQTPPRESGLRDYLFSCWLCVVGALLSLLLLTWLLLYLLSLRKQYSFKGKHVLITGGSSGIGKAVAKEALLRGAASVTLLARDEERLEAARNELEKLITTNQQQELRTISVDVCSETLQKDLEAELSGQVVDVLINSAGVTHAGSFLETSLEDFEKQLRVNVLGSVGPTQAVLPEMIRRGQGRIVFISSMAGQMALHGYTAYSASKFAVRGMAEVLDMELKVHNIRVSVSFPPDTDTPMLQGEMKQRSPILLAQTSYGGVFKAQSVARDIVRGVERGKFLITHGFDGFLLGVIVAGMSPPYHWVTIFTEVLLMGLFRAVGCVYIALFYHIVNREVKKAKKNT